VTTRALTDELAALWGTARIVVVDCETVRTDEGLRAVSVAAVTCRGGFVRGKWQTLIDPEVPVDADSVRIHGLTDDHLAGEPTFAEIAPTLLAALEPHGDEQVVFAAHNVAFDITVLRSELQRLDLDLPNVVVLDTMGLLPSVAGVTVTDRSLAELCRALDIGHERSHDALFDAVVCADAVVELIARAAEAGHTNLDELLERVSGAKTTLTVEPLDLAKLFRPARSRGLPAEHVATHTTLLSPRAGARMLDDWRNQVVGCARLRCRHLDDRVANAGPHPARIIPLLETVLDDRLDEGDTAGAATVLGALLPLLEHLPPRAGRLGFRNATLAWAQQWRPRLDTLGRCGRRDQCPTCRRGDPCPLDTWPSHVAQLALGDPDRYARGFFETTGKEAGTGAYTVWRNKGLDRVADAAVWECVSYWRNVGQRTRADQLAQLAVGVSCHHPDVASIYAANVAAAGTATDLTAALHACDLILAHAGDDTSDGWVRLRARRNQIAGRLQRLSVRPSGQIDEDGNPIPVRRHHPITPRRTRTPRFQRQ
jgi:DNA polymerase III epsilon subunit-like protein